MHYQNDMTYTKVFKSKYDSFKCIVIVSLHLSFLAKKMLKRENSVLFSPIKINNLILPNRFMRSATWEGLSDDKNGMPSRRLLRMMKELAVGECGLIVPGYVYPIFHGKSAKNQSGFQNLWNAKAWEPTINEIHELGSKIIFQICHGGVRCNPDFIGGFQPIGCYPENGFPGKEMNNDEIEEVIDSFVKAAKLAKKVGADGVQLHGAHAYLFSAFLSPALNKRKDKWGGSFDNRLRIVYETANEIRKATGNDFFLSIKINSNDYADPNIHGNAGITPELCGRYINCLPMIDLFELSGGASTKNYTIRSKIDEDFLRRTAKKEDIEEIIDTAHRLFDGVPYVEAYHADAARKIRKISPQAKLAIAGGIRSFSVMEQLVKEGTADVISLSRPFLREPHLVRDLKSGKIKEISCNSCGLCTINRKYGIFCHNPENRSH